MSAHDHGQDAPLGGNPRPTPSPHVEDRDPRPAALLEVEQLEVVYQRVVTAVQGITVRVDPGEIVALLGPNGAGKTTTLRAVSGFLDADDARITEGRVRYEGATITGAAPHALARRGLVLVPEREKIFESLTVRENLIASASPPSRRRGPRTSRTAVAERDGAPRPAGRPAVISLDQILDHFPVLASRHRQLAGYLSGGERQMLALASALCCQPRILLVDE